MPKKRFTFTLDEKVMLEIDQFIDGVTIRSRSEAVENFLRNYLSERKTAVLLAGGKPENLYLQDKKCFRPLVKISKDKTLIEDTILKIRSAGWENIYIIGMGQVITALYAVLRNGEDFGVKIKYIEELEVLGTAKTLQMVQNEVKSDFLVIPTDTYFDFNLAGLLDYHIKNKSTATFAIYSRTTFDSKYKGIVEMEGSVITKHIERPDKPLTHLVKTFIAIFSPEVFEYIPAGKIRYTLENHVINDLIKERKCLGYLVSGDWFNIHTSEDIDQLEDFIRKKNN